MLDAGDFKSSQLFSGEAPAQFKQALEMPSFYHHIFDDVREEFFQFVPVRYLPYGLGRVIRTSRSGMENMTDAKESMEVMDKGKITVVGLGLRYGKLETEPEISVSGLVEMWSKRAVAVRKSGHVFFQ